MNQGDRQRAEDMLRDADIALHQAKARGKDQPYVLFDSAMYDQMVRLMQLERDLRRALEQREFEVFYQPIINLATGALKGFEALVRWRHPQRGLVSPADFIPVAEETMLIVPLGWEVLADACRRLATWTRCYPERMPITICVNLSSRQLLDSGLFEDIRRLLAETGCDPVSYTHLACNDAIKTKRLNPRMSFAPGRKAALATLAPYQARTAVAISR